MCFRNTKMKDKEPAVKEFMVWERGDPRQLWNKGKGLLWSKSIHTTSRSKECKCDSTGRNTDSLRCSVLKSNLPNAWSLLLTPWGALTVFPLLFGFFLCQLLSFPFHLCSPWLQQDAFYLQTRFLLKLHSWSLHFSFLLKLVYQACVWWSNVTKILHFIYSWTVSFEYENGNKQMDGKWYFSTIGQLERSSRCLSHGLYIHGQCWMIPPPSIL